MKHDAPRWGWLAVPLAAWLSFFLVLPVAFVIAHAFWTRGSYGEVQAVFTTTNFGRIADPLYFLVFARSLVLAVMATLVTAILGYPVALTLAAAPKRVRQLLFVMLMVPFLTNFIVRVYALRLLLGVEGPLNQLLLSLGVVAEPLVVTDTVFLVGVGMTTNYLPFMVLPLYVVLEKLDFSLVEAARDLGATRWQTFRRVILPLTKPGLASGALLVFIPTLGEYMVPDLLGGARVMLLGNLITEQFLKARDWPFGSALAVILILVMGFGFFVKSRVAPGEDGLTHG